MPVGAEREGENPAELALDGVPILLAVHLTRSWNQSTWERVGQILADPPVVERVNAAVPVRIVQRQRRLDAEKMDQVVADYLTGMSAAVVGRKYGINASTVLNNLHARGISPRSAQRVAISGESLKRALRLRDEGWTLEAIGKEFGTSPNTVANTLQRAGRA